MKNIHIETYRSFYKKLLLIVAFLVFFSSHPVAFAADGSGTASVTPTSVVVGSTGNAFTTTYTASEDIQGGGIKITTPTGWSAPQLSAGTAGRVTISSTGTIGKVENAMDSATGWSDSSLFIATSADTGVKKEGAASIKAAVLASVGSGTVYYDYGSSQDWSSYNKLSFWFQSSVALSVGDVKLLIAESPALGGAVQFSLPSLTISALVPGTWVHVVVDLSGSTGSTRDAVRSFGFQIPITLLSNFYFDNVMLGPSTVPLISGQTVEVPIMDLPSSGTVTVTYGQGGGTSGVTVGTAAASKTLAVQSRIDSGGTYASIAASPSITLSPGSATTLQLTSEPASISAGLPMTPVVVTLKDQYGNVATGNSSTQVTLGLAAAPSGGSLGGTTTVTAINGVATFSNVYPTLPGSGYQLSASASGFATINSGNTLTALGGLVAESGGTTAVTEGGVSDTYTLVLNAAPTSDVTVTLSHDADITLDHSELVFTTGNWNIPQTVTVTAVDDASVEGTETSTITQTVTSSDLRFNGVSVLPVSVQVTDNDSAPEPSVPTSLIFSQQPVSISAGLTITPIIVTVKDQYGSTMTTDNSTSVTLSLGTAPMGGSLSGTLTATAVSGLATFSGLSIPQAGTGYTFSAAASGLPTISTTSFTVLGSLVSTGGGVSVTEGGAGDTYSLVLNAVPTGDVTVTVHHGSQLSILNDTLVFTTGNWNIPQDVTVSAPDDSVAEGTHTSTLTHTAASTDLRFNGIATPNVTVTISDPGMPAPSVATALSLTGAPTSISVGHTISPPFEVTVFDQYGDPFVGSSMPITLSLDTAPSGGAISGTTTVSTSSGVADFNGLSVHAVGSGYRFVASTSGLPFLFSSTYAALGGLSNQSGGATTVTEGGMSDTFSVELSGAPNSDVSITFSHDDQVTLSPDSVTFNSSNWNIPQIVTVTAVDDENFEGADTSIISGSVTSADSRFDGTPFDNISVSITDNDSRGGGGGGSHSGGSHSSGGGSPVSISSTQQADVDGDGIPETAIDADGNTSNGYETYSGGAMTTAVLTTDGDGDGKMDYFIDTNKDAIPDTYWDPDNGIKSVIAVRDENGDTVLDWAYDANGDGVLDHYYDSVTKKIVVITDPNAVVLTCPRYGHQGVLVHKGSKGTSVMGVQKAINQMNIMDTPLVVDGIAGSKSYAAIKVAQQMLGTKVDGLWGAVTESMYAAWVQQGCPALQ